MPQEIGIHPKRVEVEPYSERRLCSLIGEIRGAGALPFIRTRYAQTPIVVGGKKCILVVAYGGKGRAKSRWLCGVPERDIADFEMYAGDFKRVLPRCSLSIQEQVKTAPPPFIGR